MVTKDLQFQQLPLIQLKVFTGIVLQGETWSSTHVSSSGGGGYLHNGTGRIAAPTVHSHTTTHQTVWIKEEDSQKDIKLNIPSNVDVMQGHKIKYVQLFYEDRLYIDPTYIENFNAEKYWIYDENIINLAVWKTRKRSMIRMLLVLLSIPISIGWSLLLIIFVSFHRGISTTTTLCTTSPDKVAAADLVDKIKKLIISC